jgi:prepilin-type N-terminal cleavage/methylation domain-containing protein
MTRQRNSQRGVTMIELMVVVAVMAIVAATAAIGMGRARPRANLVGATVELRSVLNLARQRALMSGLNVAVMVFPGYASSPDSLGRIIVYQDAGSDLFKATAPVHFGTYDPAVLAAGVNDEVIATLDLPRGVVVGPSVGLGSTPLAAPFTGLPVNSDCTFCQGAGTARRGAVVFNSRGRASFYMADGLPIDVPGGSVSLTSTDIAPSAGTPLVRMVTINAATGTLQSFNQG